MKRKRHQVVNVEQSRLNAIEKRLRDVTPGQWRRDDLGDRVLIATDKYIVAECTGVVRQEGNADFIAYAPEDVDYLLACIESLREDVDDLKEELEAAGTEDEDDDEWPGIPQRRVR